MKSIDYTDEFLQKRRERQKKARKRRLITTFIFIMFLLLLVGVILSLTVLFPINTLKFSGSNIYTPQQIEDASGIDVGDNIFALSEKLTLEKLRGKLPYIETVKFERILPDTLKVKVSDAKKYACYKVDDNYFTVSYSGWVLEKTTEPAENVFLVEAKGIECYVGKQLSFEKDETKILLDEIIKLLNNEDIYIDYINVTNDVNLVIGVENRFDVELGTDNLLEGKIKHLKGMIDNIEEGKSGRINLSVWNSQNRQGTFVQNNAK